MWNLYPYYSFFYQISLSPSLLTAENISKAMKRLATPKDGHTAAWEDTVCLLQFPSISMFKKQIQSRFRNSQASSVLYMSFTPFVLGVEGAAHCLITISAFCFNSGRPHFSSCHACIKNTYCSMVQVDWGKCVNFSVPAFLLPPLNFTALYPRAFLEHLFSN